jgi:ABC-type nickel/cobalt efflux system permease component RcnA
MTIILSITGLIKTVLIILGVFLLLKFLGQILIAKRNLAEQKAHQNNQNRLKKEKEFVSKNTGRISISKNKNSKAIDVDFEEVK